ncbi:MAG TPA: MmcQ/YjbR family DNA-binding protein [Thermoanaerobaculia bacterium]|jgi:hypothetical protein|nr:MmcQ/YjbR family DNA-binding protein [Thermoanaerobaculia bacterium]
MPPSNKLEAIRQVCKSLRDTYEELLHGCPSFFVTEGPYLMFLFNNPGDDRLTIWVAQPPGGQEALIKMNPKYFFRPPSTDKSDWVGIDLRSGISWIAIEALIVEGHDYVYWKRKRQPERL